MNDQFYKQIYNKHQQVDAVPSNKEITTWALHVIRLLFPEQQRGNNANLCFNWFEPGDIRHDAVEAL